MATMYGVSYNLTPMSVWNLDKICSNLGITVNDIDTDTIDVYRNVMDFTTKDGRTFRDIEPNEQDALDAEFEYKYFDKDALVECDVDEDGDVDITDLEDKLFEKEK